MTDVLVVAELLDKKARKTTLSAITFAKKAAELSGGGAFDVLAIGDGAKAAAAELAGLGARKVFAAQIDGGYVAEAYTPTVADLAKKGGYGVVTATASTYGKDLLPRVAARLTPTQEVPPIVSLARGSFSATIDEAASTVTYELHYEGFDSEVVQAHLHTAQPGVNGGIMVWLCGSASLPGPPGTPPCPQAPGSVTGRLTAEQVVGPSAQGISPGEFDEMVRAIRGATRSGMNFVSVSFKPRMPPIDAPSREIRRTSAFNRLAFSRLHGPSYAPGHARFLHRAFKVG